METCFKILQLKFDKKLTNRCIGLTLHIPADNRSDRMWQELDSQCAGRTGMSTETQRPVL